MQKIYKSEDALSLLHYCDSKNINIWIDGWWWVDALLWKQTREHEDIDIVIEKCNLSQLKDFLVSQWFSEILRDDSSPHNFVMWNKWWKEVDFHVIEFDENWNGIYWPIKNWVSYPHYAFSWIGSIKWKKLKCLSAEYQLESHLSGYTLREKDKHDIKLLCKKFKLRPK